MINLSASGGSVTFEFIGNSGYLQDGTINVPVNSLSMIIDESDMVTFRKPNNDVFISALLSEFGKTKEEMIALYKANMVGSTGGGGGITSGEVQTMIDESISGKVNTVDNQVDAYVETSSAETGGLYYSFSADSYANSAFYYHSEDQYHDAVNRVGGSITIVDSSDNIVEEYSIPSGQQTTSWNPNSQYFTVAAKSEDAVVIVPVGDYRIKTCNISVGGFEVRNTAKYYTTTVKYPSYQSAEAIENNVYPKFDSLDAAISGKLDASAYTPVTIDSAITSGSTNPVQSSAIFDKVAINVEESGSTSGSALNKMFTFNFSDGVGYFTAAIVDREDTFIVSNTKYKSSADGEEKTMNTGDTDDYT